MIMIGQHQLIIKIILRGFKSYFFVKQHARVVEGLLTNFIVALKKSLSTRVNIKPVMILNHSNIDYFAGL